MKITKVKIITVAIAACVLVVVACIPKGHREKAVEEENPVYTVKTSVIKKQNLQEYMLLNGNVKADNTISVYPDIGGKLVDVPVTLGSYVKRNQVIAMVDPSVPGAVYAKSPVFAPIEGYITSLPLTNGTTVTTSTEIAKIGNINKLQIEVKIPEGKIADLKNGLTAEVALEAYRNVFFPAHIFRISPIVDETSRTKVVYFVFDTSDARINAGMYVRIKLYTVMHEDIIAIPADSFITSAGKKYVYVVNDDMTVRKAEVQTGVTVDSMTEIISVVSENDKIVTSGMQVLSDGVTVRDVEEKQTGDKE